MFTANLYCQVCIQELEKDNLTLWYGHDTTLKRFIQLTDPCRHFQIADQGIVGEEELLARSEELLLGPKLKIGSTSDQSIRKLPSQDLLDYVADQ
jgi:hypothetical protein